MGFPGSRGALPGGSGIGNAGGLAGAGDASVHSVVGGVACIPMPAMHKMMSLSLDTPTLLLGCGVVLLVVCARLKPAESKVLSAALDFLAASLAVVES